MRNLLTRFIEARGIRPDQYDRYRQMGTDIQVAWERVDRAAQALRQSFTEAILATQREFPNRPDPSAGRPPHRRARRAHARRSRPSWPSR